MTENDSERGRLAFSPFEAVEGSSDINLRDRNGKLVGRVYSTASGQENAPSDAEALRNLSLFAWAPRMREALEVVVDRPSEPMHPRIAQSIKDLLTDIDIGFSESIALQRRLNQEREARIQAMRQIAAARVPVAGTGSEDASGSPGQSQGL